MKAKKSYFHDKSKKVLHSYLKKEKSQKVPTFFPSKENVT